MTSFVPSLFAALGLAAGAVLGWPMGWLGTRLARQPIAPWATSVAAAAACGVAAASRAGAPASAMVGVGLALALVLLTAIDIAVLRLPDVLTLPLTVAGLALGPAATAPFLDRLVGAGLGFASLLAAAAIFRRLRGRSGLGLGDAKLFAAAGAWLGWDQLPQVLLLACAVGLSWAAVRCLRFGRASLLRPIPFGVGLCVGLLAVWTISGTVPDQVGNPIHR